MINGKFKIPSKSNGQSEVSGINDDTLANNIQKS